MKPMSHLNTKPRPPTSGGRETSGKAVDSSAMVMAPGKELSTAEFILRRKSTAPRLMLPPSLLGVHSPCLRP